LAQLLHHLLCLFMSRILFEQFKQHGARLLD
jgi:hypothetical protein